MTLASIVVGVVCGLGAARAAPGDDAWSADFYRTGLDGIPYAYVEWRGDLIVAGEFGTAGPTCANRIARYDGDSWHALGTGLDGTVWDLVAWGEDLVACGDFWHAGGAAAAHVARWDGSAWQALGAGVPAGVRALAVYQGDLYCDRFRWDGESWVDVLGTNGVVRDFVEQDGLLVAGGAFDTASGAATGHVLVWDGWEVRNDRSGQASPVIDLELWNGRLHALRDCSFSWSCSPVCCWQDSAWADLPNPQVDAQYHAMALRAGQLVLAISHGGGFGTGYAQLCRWDGSQWRREGYQWQGYVASLSAWGDALIAGGDFSTWDRLAVSNIVRLDGTSPSVMVQGGLAPTGPISSVAVGDSLAIGGHFESVGQSPAFGVAVWTGGGWSARGLGGTWYGGPLAWHVGVLNCVAVSYSDRTSYSHRRWLAGGWFPSWDLYVPFARLVSWHDRLLGVGFDAIYDATDPFAWSVFAQVDGSAPRLVAWDGRLVAFGAFTAIGGVPAEGLAVHDGERWAALAPPEYAPNPGPISVLDGRLVAAQSSADDDGASRTWIAIIDGSGWVPLAVDVEGTVSALQEWEGQLVAAGRFQRVDGVDCANIARWDGQAWRPLGSGTDGAVHGLGILGGRLWVWGAFGRAGGRPAAGLCVWRDEAVPTFLRSLTAQRLSNGDVRVSWEVGEARAGEYVLERAARGGASVALPAVAATGRTRFEQLDADAPAWVLVYRLRHRAPAEGSGAGELLGEADVAALDLPAATRLLPPSPNPFNPAVALRFDLARPGPVRLAVYDARGRRLATLLDEACSAGAHEAAWRGTDAQGRPQPSGVYFARLEADGAARTVKLTLAR